MKVTVDIEINKPKSLVWSAITDIENSPKMISGITALKILEQPENGVVGLKWEETRLMFSKEATETMWITEAVENEYYSTRAENHGAVYITKLSLSESGSNTLLTMTFSGEVQSGFFKIVSAVMGFLVKGSMKKMLQKDLEDIKKYIETSL